MSEFKFDKKQMTFVGLTEEQRIELREMLFDTVVNGTSVYNNKYFIAWCEEFFPNNETHKLLIMSTVFPQRVALSLLA